MATPPKKRTPRVGFRHKDEYIPKKPHTGYGRNRKVGSKQGTTKRIKSKGAIRGKR